MESPLGDIELCVSDAGVVSVLFVKTLKKELEPKEVSLHPLLTRLSEQLSSYFKNQRSSFDLPLDLQGTPFQKRVWHQLATIPFSKTINYLELARQLGDEKCIRAAASANGKNPVSIIVPCHRVVGSNGKLVGYSGDLNRKQWLLQHEGAYSDLFSGH